MLAASGVFQVIFPGTLAVSPGLLPICGIMENIQNLLGVFSGLVEQGNILGITDIRRCAGSVHDHGAAVSASSSMGVRVIIVILGFGLFFLTILCVPHDHLVDFAQHLRRQPLAEVHHQRWVKGQLFVIIAGIPTEVLKIRVLLDLKCSFLVGVAILRLDDAGSQRQPQRLGHIALAVGKQSGVPLLNLQPRNCLGFLYPAVAFFQIHAHWLLEIRQTDLSIAVTIHSRPPCARVLLDSCGLLYTYCTTNGLLCLEI